MKKILLPMLRQGIPFYFLTFFFIFGFGLFGTILFEVTMRLSEVRAENPQTFEMAFLMSVIAFMGVLFLFAMQIVQRNFQTAVGMSCTRKSFFVGSMLCALVSAVFGIASLFIVSLTEQLRLRYWWNEYPCESKYLESITPAMLLFFMFAFVVLSELMGVLFLRFGKLAFWVLWLLWMIGCFSIPRILDDMDEKRDTVFSGIGHMVRQIVFGLPPFAWLLIGTALLVLLLFISYRILMRQQVA